jgi:hypothetical protein
MSIGPGNKDGGDFVTLPKVTALPTAPIVKAAVLREPSDTRTQQWKSDSKTSMAKFPSSHSWIFHGFPELDPDAILRQEPGEKILATEEERQRAWWLWQRRSREMKVLALRHLAWGGSCCALTLTAPRPSAAVLPIPCLLRAFRSRGNRDVHD